MILVSLVVLTSALVGEPFVVVNVGVVTTAADV